MRGKANDDRGWGVFVASAIGVTVSAAELATYAVAPSGVIAIPSGIGPTGMGVPGEFVPRSSGVTVSFAPLVT